MSALTMSAAVEARKARNTRKLQDTGAIADSLASTNDSPFGDSTGVATVQGMDFGSGAHKSNSNRTEAGWADGLTFLHCPWRRTHGDYGCAGGFIFVEAQCTLPVSSCASFRQLAAGRSADVLLQGAGSVDQHREIVGVHDVG